MHNDKKKVQNQFNKTLITALGFFLATYVYVFIDFDVPKFMIILICTYIKNLKCKHLIPGFPPGFRSKI